MKPEQLTAFDAALKAHLKTGRALIKMAADLHGPGRIVKWKMRRGVFSGMIREHIAGTHDYIVDVDGGGVARVSLESIAAAARKGTK